MNRARNGALALLAATGAGVRAVMKRRRAQEGAGAPDPSLYASGPGNPTLVTQSSPGAIAAEQEAHGAEAATSAAGSGPSERGSAGEPGEASGPPAQGAS